MKKLLKSLYVSKFGVFARNLTGFRPPISKLPYQKQFLSSDLFIWRTDNNFETIFNASDILGKFYGLNSSLYFLFFDANGKYLFSKEIFFNDGIINLLIDKNFVTQEAYGTFCVFNIPLEKSIDPLSVTNRCYIGYGKNKAFSMVHGNLNSVMVTNPYTPLKDIINKLKPALTSHKKKYTYFIQKKPSPNTETSFGFANPLGRKIKVELNNIVVSIPPRGCSFIEIPRSHSNTPYVVKSDFCYARPILICETDSFIDCLHG